MKKSYRKSLKNFNKTRKNNSKEFEKPAIHVYSQDDYNSNDGMLTTVWGPSMWHCLHTISFNYPVEPTDENKKHYMDFVLSLRFVLPCGKCRKNLAKNLKKLPITMDAMKSRDTFSKYIYELHEVVNKMLKKKSGLSYEDVRERYEHFRARCINKKDRNKTKKVRFSKDIEVINKKFSKKETGCVVPLYGEKAKCVLHIVPQDKQCESFNIDEKCIKKRLIM